MRHRSSSRLPLGTTGVFPRPVCAKQTSRLPLPWPSCCFDSFKAFHPNRIRCFSQGRNPTRNPIPSCTSLFRALPRHPIGHRYQRLSLLPFQRLQGIIPLWQCSRCCHPNLTLLSFSLQGFLPAQSCSHTSAGLPSCRYPCGPDFKVLTLTEQIGLLLNAPCCQKTNAAFPPGVATGTCTRTIRDALFKLTRSSLDRKSVV